MKTTEFLQILKENKELPLYFEYEAGAFVRPDYHVTEIKNVSFDTVDCGGVQSQWEEVHAQLWENEKPEPNHQLTAEKIFSIFNAVEKVRETWKEVELLFEYQNRHFHKAVLPVSSYYQDNDSVIFQLGQSFTTCKAKDRATTEEEKELACCGPSEPVIKKENQQCAPGSGCC